MAKRSPVARARKNMPVRMRSLFGDAPVLSEDDKRSHEDMLAMFAQHVEPDDLIGWINAWDIVSHTLESSLLRRLKIQALQRRVEGADIEGSDWNDPLREAWLAFDRAAKGLDPNDSSQDPAPA